MRVNNAGFLSRVRTSSALSTNKSACAVASAAAKIPNMDFPFVNFVFFVVKILSLCLSSLYGWFVQTTPLSLIIVSKSS
jgi:hypothetical protein